MLILLLDRLEDIEHAKFRALAQIQVDKEAGVEAFEEYMKIAFPSLEGRKKASADSAKAALLSWIKEGPLKVTPLMGSVRSRLKMRSAARASSQKGWGSS